MATCRFCELEMNGSVSCIEVPVKIRAGEFAPVRFEVDEGAGPRCHDCDVLGGGFHHRGCDGELCPNCGGQLISFRKAPALAEGRWTENHFCHRIPVFTLQPIFDGHEVPLLVAHDGEGDWQVLDGQSVEGKEKAIAFVSDVSDLHPSLVEVLDLPAGWEAWRDDAESGWKRGPL